MAVLKEHTIVHKMAVLMEHTSVYTMTA